MVRIVVPDSVSEADLVTSVDRVIWQLVRNLGRGMGDEDLRDLHAAGVTAALIAARGFDPTYGVTFNTYAYNIIRGAVATAAVEIWTRGMGRASPSVRKVYYAYAKARRQLGEDASTAEIALMIDVPEEIVTDVVVAFMYPGDEVVEDVAADVADPLEEIYARGVTSRVEGALDRLTLRERRVITERFFEGKLRPEIAKHLHLTPERVRQIEVEALKKLRGWLID